MAHDAFISHSVKDKLVAEAIVARLEANSIRCWVAPRNIVPGADWGESIINAIESSRIMILVFSRDANASRQIKREVERADDKGVYTIPFRIDDIEPTKSLEYFISTAQWMDAFPPPLEPHLDVLAKTVAAVLASPPLPERMPNEPRRPEIRPAAESAPPTTQVQEADDLETRDGMTPKLPPPPGTPALPNIAGVWRDSDFPSNVSRITQNGTRFTFENSGLLPNGIRFESAGSGTISGRNLSSTYNARYQNGATSWGQCSGSVTADGMSMELTCTDSSLGTFASRANHE